MDGNGPVPNKIDIIAYKIKVRPLVLRMVTGL
jgi:hypothetical protein